MWEGVEELIFNISIQMFLAGGDLSPLKDRLSAANSHTNTNTQSLDCG